MEGCYGFLTGLPATMLSLPVHFPYCCQSSPFKRTIWLRSKTFHCSLPLVKVQILCSGIQDLSQLKQPIFLSSPATSSHFWSPWSNSLFPIHTMSSHIGLFTGSVFDSAPTHKHRKNTWPVKPSTRLPFRQFYISIRTPYVVPHLTPLFPIPPTDHECMRGISDWPL